MMIYLSEKCIKEIIGIDMAVEAMYETFRLLESGDFACGGKTAASHGMQLRYKKDGENALFISMPGYAGGKYQISGVKWHGPMNSRLGGSQESRFTMVLNDAYNGTPLCIMNADEITALRTAAVNIVAAQELAPENATALGIIGPGRINTITAAGILKKNPGISKVYVKGRGKKSLETFVSSIGKDFKDVKIIEVDQLKELVLNSDIISMMTGFQFDDITEMPNIRDRWIDRGVLFICGSFAFFSDTTLTRNINRVCDMFGMYESYEEELGYPAYHALSNLGNKFADLVIENRISIEQVTDIGDVINDRSIIDRSLPTLFSSGGIVIEDLVFGKIIYDHAVENGLGIRLDGE